MDQSHQQMFFAIPADVLQAVVNYMSERPFKEVGGVMPKLVALTLTAESQAIYEASRDRNGQKTEEVQEIVEEA